MTREGKKLSNRYMKGFAQLAVIIFLLLAIGAGITLLRQPNIFKSTASSLIDRQKSVTDSDVDLAQGKIRDKPQPAPSSTSHFAVLSFSPLSGTYNKGCNFKVNINLDTGGNPTDGTDAVVLFDPKRLSVKTVKNGTLYSSYPAGDIDNNKGRLVVSGLSSSSSFFTGSGTLATIEFQVLSGTPPGSAYVKFDFDPYDMSKTTDSNVVKVGVTEDILGRVDNASFTIGSASCQSAPVPTGVKAFSSVSLTPNPAVPNQTIKIKVAGSASCVENASNPPAVTSINNVPGYENCNTPPSNCSGQAGALSCVREWTCTAGRSPGDYKVTFTSGNGDCRSEASFSIQPAPTPTPYSILEILPKSLAPGATIIAKVKGSTLCSANSKVESTGFVSCSAPTGGCDSAAATCWGEFSCTAVRDPGNYQAVFSAADNPACSARSDFQVTGTR